jgi:hypothetical protein
MSSEDPRIDPKTGILAIAFWGPACGRGFVSDSRFGKSDTVIKRSSHAKTKQYRKVKATRDGVRQV